MRKLLSIIAIIAICNNASAQLKVHLKDSVSYLTLENVPLREVFQAIAKHYKYELVLRGEKQSFNAVYTAAYFPLEALNVCMYTWKRLAYPYKLQWKTNGKKLIIALYDNDDNCPIQL